MALTTTEKNRRKRQRKKREREEQKKVEEEQALKRQKLSEDPQDEEIEVEYVAETALLPSDDTNDDDQESLASVMKRFQQRAAVAVVTDDEKIRLSEEGAGDVEHEEDGESEHRELSRRRQRELSRPSVADLKRRVKRPDLVEAHDVTAPDPDFLIHLKGVAGTVPVPRHWGRKRKYLQGKRGIEKPPFQLPDFIVKTGITEIRDTLAEDESKMSAKQRNRSRVAPKMGGIDVDYRTLHDAFFKYQTKPDNLTSFGDLYYEGKEFETHNKFKPGAPLSAGLSEALGMTSENSPPPWLVNMQRYGPPPSYPSLKIPGLNAPLPDDSCQYGYHSGGWGKPPVDGFGRPLYGGNPFAKPGGGDELDPFHEGGLVTSDGKTIGKVNWGSLPTGHIVDEEQEDEAESSEEESSDEEMESEDDEEKDEGQAQDEVTAPNMPPPTAVLDLRKQAGDETPVDAGPKQLYTVLQQKQADEQQGAVFASDVAYDVGGAAAAPEGAESVLSKALPSNEKSQRKTQRDDDDEEDLGKFKF